MTALVAAAALAASRLAGAAELMITEVTDLAFDVHAPSDTIVFSALGQIWRMPLDGGLATALTPERLVLDRPRLSPDGRLVVAEGGDSADRHSIWVVPAAGGTARELTTAAGRHADADWHPDGRSVVFSSDRGGGRDLWAIRMADGVEWQLTAAAGDEYDPSWEPDGSGVLYAERGPNGNAIRRLGTDGTSSVLATRDGRVSAPRRRPGGPAIVFVETGPDGRRTLQLLLPIAERAVKPLLSAVRLEDEPVAWRDRDRYFVAHDGQIYERELAGPPTRNIPLTAFVSVAGTAALAEAAPAPRERATPRGRNPPIVLRATRVFDPVSGRHLEDHDVRLDTGRVAEVVPRRDWGDVPLFEFPDSTVLPGFIDTTLRERAGHGTARLVAGVTAVAVAGDGATRTDAAGPVPEQLPVRFADVRAIDGHAARIEAIRGARAAGLQVIGARLLPDLRFGVTTLDGAALPAASEAAPRYADVAGLLRLSGVAVRDAHRAATTPDIAWQRSRVAVTLNPGGSRPPAALAPALDIISRHADGEPVATLLRGITLDAARAAGRSDLGRIGAGAVADLVVVPGDPLTDPAVLLDPIAVVRAGQLHSVSGLLEGIAQRRDTLQSRDASVSGSSAADPR